ncbi:hypothetical protein DEAB109302_14910 [Dermacoccus abyssi]
MTPMAETLDKPSLDGVAPGIVVVIRPSRPSSACSLGCNAA